MEKKIKAMEVVEAYKVLSSAKYQKLSDEDKVKVWKVSHQMKPIAMKVEEARADAQAHFIPQEFMGKLALAQQYEQLKGKEEKLPMTPEEYKEVVQELAKYNNMLREAMHSIYFEEVTLNIEPLSEETFGNLMASNDWTLGEAELLNMLME